MNRLSFVLPLLAISLLFTFGHGLTAPAPLDAAVENTFLGLLVTTEGSPTLGTTGGSPETTADNDQPLLFGWPFGANTSFTSLWLDGEAVSLRDTPPGAGPVSDGDAITTTWRVGDVEVTQTHALAPNPYTSRPDTVRITTTLRNTGAATHTVGVRVLLDLQVGGSDAPTALIPGDGVITTERDYRTPIPPFYRFFGAAAGGPDAVQALGLLTGPGVTPPNRVVLGRWSALDRTVWEYTATPEAPLDDSALALWWEPAPLPPGATRTLSTAYGLARRVTGDAWFDAPVRVGCAERGFTVTLWVRNRGERAWAGGQAVLTLPAGLVLAEGETAVKAMGDVPPGGARSVTWHLVAAQPGDWAYSAAVSFAEGDPLATEGTVRVLPCAGTPTPTVTPTVTVAPSVTPTTTVGRSVYLPLIRKGNRGP